MTGNRWWTSGFIGYAQPDYAGKLNFYVELVDDVSRDQHHNGTFGILICASKNDHTVRYSTGRATSPTAVASGTYEIEPAEVHQRTPIANRRTAALD
jgi:hypothetical protein